MPDPRPWDVLLVNGATRIPITLATDTGGRLAYQVDDETQGEKERLLWEQGEFTGGLGQQFVRDPTRYLMANNVDAARDQGFRLSPLITYTDQGASPYTVRAGTPEIRSGECRPIAFDEDTVISVSSSSHSVGAPSSRAAAKRVIRSGSSPAGMASAARTSAASRGSSAFMVRVPLDGASSFRRALHQFHAPHDLADRRVVAVEHRTPTPAA